MMKTENWLMATTSPRSVFVSAEYGVVIELCDKKGRGGGERPTIKNDQGSRLLVDNISHSALSVKGTYKTEREIFFVEIRNRTL